MSLYTKSGRPLQVSGDLVYSRSGKLVGRISGDRVHGPDGRYVGTISCGRLVYRSTDRATLGGRFTAGNVAGTAQANSVGAAISGDEPNIPD